MTTTTMVIIFALIALFGCVFALTYAYIALREDFDKQHAELQSLISNAKNAFEGSKSIITGEQK